MKLHKEKIFQSESFQTIAFMDADGMEFDNEEQANGVKTCRLGVDVLEGLVKILKSMGNQFVYLSVVGHEEPVFVHTKKEMSGTVMAIATCRDD